MGKHVVKVTPLFRAKIQNTTVCLELYIRKCKGGIELAKKVLQDNAATQKHIEWEQQNLKRAQEILKYWRQVLKRTA